MRDKRLWFCETCNLFHLMDMACPKTAKKYENGSEK